MRDDSAFSGCERYFVETRDASSPENLLIKFERFWLYSESGIYKYKSRVFEAGGYKWKMIIYPEGHDIEDDDCNVFVCFAVAETKSLPVGWEVNAIFAFFVYNHHKNNYLCFRGTTRRFNALTRKGGFSNVISTDTLLDPSKGFLVDNNCVFGAEVYVIKNQPINECMSLQKDIASFKREWKISGFSELGHVWTSEQFEVGDHKWKVELYPRGQCMKDRDLYVSIFLMCVDIENSAPHHKVKVEAIMRIKNQIDHAHHCDELYAWYTPSKADFGQPKFISIDDIKNKGYLINDCCFLEIEICLQAVVLDAPKM